MPHDGKIRIEGVLLPGQYLAQQENGGQVIALIPVARSLLNGYFSPQFFAHNGLVAQNRIIKAARIREGYFDPQQLLNPAYIPARRYANNRLEGIASRVEQRKTELVQ